MNTKTIFSVQYNGSRYQVREISSGSYARYDILQDRRIIKNSKYFTRRTAILELLQILRLDVIQS